MKTLMNQPRLDSRATLLLTTALAALLYSSTTHRARADDPSFVFTVGDENLPRSGAKAWCRRPEVIKNILVALNDITEIKKSGEKAIDFKDASTVGLDPVNKTAACHGVINISNGQLIAGTFTLENNAAGSSIWHWMNDQSSATAQRQPPNPETAQRPEDETAFLTAIAIGVATYQTATTEFAKGSTRPGRAKLICGSQKTLRVENWIGTLTKLTTTSEGKGVVAIELASGVKVETWPAGFVDGSYGTLVEPNSDLFNKLGRLDVSQKVKFSGSFFPDRADCFKELSLTARGAMTEPEFLMRFTNIEKY